MIAWAQERIRVKQRSGEELLPDLTMEPGVAHLAGVNRYHERNLAGGKCYNCPEPRDTRSDWYSTKHLLKMREKYTRQETSWSRVTDELRKRSGRRIAKSDQRERCY